MFKQGQQADVTLAFDSLEKSDVSVARVEFYVVIEDIGDRLATDQQVHQLLVDAGQESGSGSTVYLFPVASFKATPGCSSRALRSALQ